MGLVIAQTLYFLTQNNFDKFSLRDEMEIKFDSSSESNKKKRLLSFAQGY